MRWCYGCCLLFFGGIAVLHAMTLPMPSVGNVVGKVTSEALDESISLASFARAHGIGIEQLLEANPGIQTHRNLPRGTVVRLPLQFVLPDVAYEGIVVNLAEQRLYFFPKHSHVVITEPVGIGKGGAWQTPIGVTRVTAKQSHPQWRPPASVRFEAARNGTPIPKTFPPGKDNPLGDYLLRLGWSGYLIHGTNQPDAVGSRVSAGCIRLLPEGIKALYPRVTVGTSVTVVDDPIKIGSSNAGSHFLEVHRLSQGNYAIVDLKRRLQALSGKAIDWTKVATVVSEHVGYPRSIDTN